MNRRAIVIGSILTLLAPMLGTAQPASKPAADAWPLYAKAIEHIKSAYAQHIECPATSNLSDFNDFPPYPPAWHQLERSAFAFNAPARALVRQARACTIAHWPEEISGGKLDFRYLNGCRALANDIADAAMYEHLEGNDAAAIESVRDLLHMADLLDASTASPAISLLVAAGFRAISLNRLEASLTEISFTDDPTDAKRLQISVAKDLLRQLLDSKDPNELHGKSLDAEVAASKGEFDKERCLLTLRRVHMERRLAAMSIACHLFQHDKSRWPESLAEVITYLPAPPADAWGPMGYALVKAGRPDGSDRPLVYSRYGSEDGLFYRVDGPQFGLYNTDGSGRPAREQKHGGQFRDVALWQPPVERPSPTTRRLP